VAALHCLTLLASTPAISLQGATLSSASELAISRSPDFLQCRTHPQLTEASTVKQDKVLPFHRVQESRKISARKRTLKSRVIFSGEGLSYMRLGEVSLGT